MESRFEGREGEGEGTCLSAGLATLFVCEFAGVWEGCGRLCGCCLLARAKTRHCSVGVVVEEFGCGDVNVCSVVASGSLEAL